MKGDEPILLILPAYDCMLTQPDISYYLYIYIYIANVEENTIKWIVHDGVTENYWPVVMNYRGRGGVLLKVFSKIL